MKKSFKVTKSTKILLNNEEYLLEKGDKLFISSEYDYEGNFLQNHNPWKAPTLITNCISWDDLRKIHPQLPESSGGWHRHNYDSYCGWVQDTAYVDSTSKVDKYAIVYGNAKVTSGSFISGHAEVSDSAVVVNTHVYGYAKVYDDAELYNAGAICGRVEICGKTKVEGYSYINKPIVIRDEYINSDRTTYYR